MAEIIVFHHILGLTPGVEAFADDLRAAGHTVHTPDLYAGRRFDSIEAGAAFAQGLRRPAWTRSPTPRWPTCRPRWSTSVSHRG